MMFWPHDTGVARLSQTRVSAASMPSGPSATAGDVDRARLEHVVGDVAAAFRVVVAQDRLVEHELMRMAGTLLEQVALGAQAAPMLITMLSRIGSIGGLVTWAKSS